MPSSVSDDLRAFLERLEIPDCDCSPPDPEAGVLPPPCPHILAAVHRLPIADWVALLRLAYPDLYADRPRARAAALALSREARIAVYETRQESGLDLWHPGDLWRQVRDDDLGVELGRARNGSDYERGVCDG